MKHSYRLYIIATKPIQTIFYAYARAEENRRTATFPKRMEIDAKAIAFSLKCVAFDSKAIAFTAKTIAFKAKAVAFDPNTIAFSPKTIAFASKAVAFDANAMVFHKWLKFNDINPLYNCGSRVVMKRLLLHLHYI